jgi:hypothetical protein
MVICNRVWSAEYQLRLADHHVTLNIYLRAAHKPWLAYDAEQWRNICSVELEDPINTHIYLLTPKKINLSAAASAFIKHLQSCLIDQY